MEANFNSRSSGIFNSISKNSRPTQSLFAGAMLIVLLATVGCGDGRPDLVPVSGQVLIDGKPLGYGFIRVVPENARAATGKLDTEGRFTLKTFEDGDGALCGVHSVSIIAGKSISDEETQWLAPEKYSQSETSGLTTEITEATDGLTINITWDGDKPYRTFRGVKVK